MSTPAAIGQVTALHPIRVLVVGTDRRFLRVADVLLRRHGCEVHCSERRSDLVEAARRHRSNVVILDGSDSLAGAIRGVTALQALPNPVATLIVYEGGDGDAAQRLRLVPKWGAFDRLLGEVQRLYAWEEPSGEDAA